MKLSRNFMWNYTKIPWKNNELQKNLKKNPDGTSRYLKVLRLVPGTCPGGEIFLKMTLFNSIKGPKIVLKSVISHMDPGPSGHFQWKWENIFIWKLKKMRIRKRFFLGGTAPKLFGTRNYVDYQSELFARLLIFSISSRMVVTKVWF